MSSTKWITNFAHKEANRVLDTFEIKQINLQILIFRMTCFIIDI